MSAMTDNADPKLGHAPDPYPHLTEAVKSYMQDLTKAAAELLAGKPDGLLALVRAALQAGAAVPADPGISAAYGAIMRRLNAQNETSYREATKAVAERFASLVTVVRNALPSGRDSLSERSAMAVLDRAGVSAGLWSFDERGHIKAGPESPGPVDELLRGIQYGNDIFRRWAGGAAAAAQHQHAPAPGQAPPDLVPRPIIPQLDPSVVALRALVQRGDILWWENDEEPDEVKRRREAVPAVRPELWDRYEAMFGEVLRDGPPNRAANDHHAFGGELLQHVARLRSVAGDMTPAQIVDVVTAAVAAWKDHATSAAPGDIGAVPLAIVWYERHAFAELVKALLPDAPGWRQRDIIEAFFAAGRKGGE